jgi:hypothetical protein
VNGEDALENFVAIQELREHLPRDVLGEVLQTFGRAPDTAVEVLLEPLPVVRFPGFLNRRLAKA